MKGLVFVDCEATGPCPGKGFLTEFGAVIYDTKETFHGILFDSKPDPENPAKCIITGNAYNPITVYAKFENWLKENVKGRPIFVSDNPAYDFQWINYGFWHSIDRNPFGHSGRRISDFYAGLSNDWFKTQGWKSLRVTTHDHNPVNDSMGNVEAFERIMKGER